MIEPTRSGAPPLGYSYDARGRLAGVTSGGSTIASYSYDWREQRVAAASTEVGQRHYVYAEDGQLLAEHDAATGAMIREYVWLDSLPLATITGPTAAPVYSWITTGNLNEPLLLTDASGAVSSSVTRDPWGNAILLAGGAPLELGFPGQHKDPATGLLQNWHRDYDPTLGRYLEADPLGLGGGSNVFAYVGGDPLNAVDPTGRNPVLAGLIIGGIIGGLINLDIQLWENGGRFVCVDWWSVAQDTAIGSATGGLGGWAIPRMARGIAPFRNKLPRFGGKPNVSGGGGPASPPSTPPMASPKKPPCHHICTNKNPVSPNFGGPWTPRFKPMFDKAGVSMNNALNKVHVPGHSGPHSSNYHREVYRRLLSATEGLEGEAFRNAFRAELGAMNRDLKMQTSILYNLLMGF